jgi:hypothetical protein
MRLPNGKIWENEVFEHLDECRHKQRNRSVAECSRKAVLHRHIKNQKSLPMLNSVIASNPNPDEDLDKWPFALTFGSFSSEIRHTWNLVLMNLFIPSQLYRCWEGRHSYERGRCTSAGSSGPHVLSDRAGWYESVKDLGVIGEQPPAITGAEPMNTDLFARSNAALCRHEVVNDATPSTESAFVPGTEACMVFAPPNFSTPVVTSSACNRKLPAPFRVSVDTMYIVFELESIASAEVILKYGWIEPLVIGVSPVCSNETCHHGDPVLAHLRRRHTHCRSLWRQNPHCVARH